MTNKKLEEIIKLLEEMASNCHTVANIIREEFTSDSNDLKLAYGLNKEGWAYENAIEILRNNKYFQELKKAHKK